MDGRDDAVSGAEETLLQGASEPLTDGALLWGRAATGAAFVVVYVVLLLLYQPRLLLSRTTTSGGDLGALHYPAKYMLDSLLPHLKMTGWTQQWYAGMPMFTFYMPVPFLMIALLAHLIPYTVAFKLVTAAGVFALPVVTYAFGRLMGIRRPFATVAAVCALGFLAMESFSIYGGNILSTLAGEFGFSISFALTFLFLGTLHRGLERAKVDRLFAVNALILMGVVLTHIVTTIVLVLVAPSLLILHRRWKAVAYLAGVFLVGFLLTAFWGLPFVDKLQWSAQMAWGQLRGFKDLMPVELWPAAVLGVVGIAHAVSKRDLKMFPVLWITVLTGVLFCVLPDGRLWNGRLLPFSYFSVWLWAAYGIALVARPLLVRAAHAVRPPPRLTLGVVVPAVAVLIVVIGVVGPRVIPPNGVTWNYSGYESKARWPQYREIMDIVGSLPAGRVMWEHEPALERFGTARAFELIPYWTDQPTMEGTLMESAFTAPYHFINQAELSQQPSKAIIGVDYPNAVNIADGIAHLQFMGVPYMLASSAEVTAGLKTDPRAELLKTVDGVGIFRIAGVSPYVTVAKDLPVRLKTTDWRGTIVPWYRNVNDLDVMVLLDQGQPALQRFPEITPAQAADPPKVPLGAQGDVIAGSIRMTDETLSFDTTAIGQPHWIKMSYFPNWHVTGALGPYLASPSFMMVIPTQRHVELRYGRTASNTIGQLFTLLGWVIVTAVLVRELTRWRRTGRYRSPVDPVTPSGR